MPVTPICAFMCFHQLPLKDNYCTFYILLTPAEWKQLSVTRGRCCSSIYWSGWTSPSCCSNLTAQEEPATATHHFNETAAFMSGMHKDLRGPGTTAPLLQMHPCSPPRDKDGRQGGTERKMIFKSSQLALASS